MGGAALLARAREKQVKVHEVGDEWLPLMDKASSGRPHNVCYPFAPRRGYWSFGHVQALTLRRDLF